jgi:hypothetical protein
LVEGDASLKLLILLFFLGLLISWSSKAEGPMVDALTIVATTDAARLMNELDAIMKQYGVLKGQASYWEDACKSTPGCGGQKPEEVK